MTDQTPATAAGRDLLLCGSVAHGEPLGRTTR